MTGCTLPGFPANTDLNVRNSNVNSGNETGDAVDEDEVGDVDGDESENAEVYWVSYSPTQCNDDPWAGYSVEKSKQRQSSTQQMIAYYETEYGVAILDSELTSFGADAVFCAACGCPKGEIYRVQVSANDRLTLLNLGFRDDTDLEQAGMLNDDPNVGDDDAEEIINAEVEDVSISDVSTADAATTDTPSTDVPITDAVVEDDEIKPTERDIEFDSLVIQIQEELGKYFIERSTYPETLAELEGELNLGESGLSGITYTPIGTVPANYYDLSVEYSTGKIVFNP